MPAQWDHDNAKKKAMINGMGINQRRIAVVGSMNMDYVVETDKLPNLGETIIIRESLQQEQVNVDYIQGNRLRI